MAETKRSIWTRLYHGETAVDFVGRKRLWFAISVLVIGTGLGSLALRGLNFGIDFEGGTAWEVPAPDVSVGDARDALRPLGLADAKVQLVGRDPPRLRVQADPGSATLRQQVTDRLAALAEAPVGEVSVDDVGPSWGEEVTQKARNALVVFLVAITLYITLRFEWKMAVATLAALVHDMLVTVGVYSVSGFEVSPATVIAVLTVLGYSIYDGIVVFDKVEENTRGLASSGRVTYADMVNLSLNQVLMRSLNTAITALLPIISLLVIGRSLGASTLQDFALALLIGLGASAYSSIFIASPILATLKEREPRYASIRQRVMSRGGSGVLTPAAAAAGGLIGARPVDAETRSRQARPAAARAPSKRPPPRPRKKGKRR
ncbi:MAG TPA: protein translocase subunit SecF [Acidimicrobiales bacterium]|nr:protein translocase subunit SecF [Acidimicrobiales bacterium]